jgi:hypothetical protein
MKIEPRRGPGDTATGRNEMLLQEKWKCFVPARIFPASEMRQSAIDAQKHALFSQPKQIAHDLAKAAGTKISSLN